MNDIFKNIDFDNLIQNLSGIGTFMTSLITLLTLRVLIKQRKDSFRPRIIFGDRIYAACVAKDDEIFRSRWRDAYPDEGKENNDFSFKLFNVGVGVAENVIISEYFDYKKAIRFIKELDKENEFEFNKIDNIVELRTAFDESFTMIYLDNKPRKLGAFIKKEQETPGRYVFNDTCLVFLSCFDYLRSKYGEIMSLDEFPNCHYLIEYFDIEGKIYRDKYISKVSSIIDSYTFTFLKK